MSINTKVKNKKQQYNEESWKQLTMKVKKMKHRKGVAQLKSKYPPIHTNR
jgi:hypothetical protein